MPVNNLNLVLAIGQNAQVIHAQFKTSGRVTLNDFVGLPQKAIGDVDSVVDHHKFVVLWNPHGIVDDDSEMSLPVKDLAFWGEADFGSHELGPRRTEVFIICLPADLR